MSLNIGHIAFQVIPPGLAFGNVPSSTTVGPYPIVLQASADNTGPAYITVASSDSRFTISPSGNLTLNPGQSVTLEVTLTTTATLGSISATFVNFTGAPPIVGGPTLTATVVGSGVPAWVLSPQAIDFGSIKIGSSSAAQNITITNGPSPLTIESVQLGLGSEFTLSGVPSLPYTLAANGTLTFTATCNAEFRGLNDYNPGVTVNPSVGPSQSVEFLYTGFVITPAYTLTGNTQGVLFGLSGQWKVGGVTSLTNTVVQSLASASCEAQASWTKMHDFNNPPAYTYANRLFFRTECYGAVTATLTSTSVISSDAVTRSDTKTRDASTDSTGVPTQMIFDIENNGEIHSLTLTVAAGAGIMVIDEYTPVYEPRGVVYESK